MSCSKTTAMDSQILGLVAQLMAIYEERSKEHAYIAQLQDELHHALQANKAEVRLNENLEGEVRRQAAEIKAKEAEIAALKQEVHDLKCRAAVDAAFGTLDATDQESDFEYDNPLFAHDRQRRASAFHMVRDLEPSSEEWGGVEISGIAETTDGLNTAFSNISPIYAV